MSDKRACCICGKEFEGYGNNPYPVMSVTKTCCDECNKRYVVTTREIYFPSGYSDDNVLFNSTPAPEVLTGGLLRALNSIREGSNWLTKTLAAAQTERKADAENSYANTEKVVD